MQNYMESLVDEALRAELAAGGEKYAGRCLCPVCQAHIKTAALNLLSPFYVTCVAGEVYGEYRNREAQNHSEVLVALGKGMDQVFSRPPHPAP